MKKRMFLAMEQRGKLKRQDDKQDGLCRTAGRVSVPLFLTFLLTVTAGQRGQSFLMAHLGYNMHGWRRDFSVIYID